MLPGVPDQGDYHNNRKNILHKMCSTSATSHNPTNRRTTHGVTVEQGLCSDH